MRILNTQKSYTVYKIWIYYQIWYPNTIFKYTIYPYLLVNYFIQKKNKRAEVFVDFKYILWFSSIQRPRTSIFNVMRCWCGTGHFTILNRLKNDCCGVTTSTVGEIYWGKHWQSAPPAKCQSAFERLRLMIVLYISPCALWYLLVAKANRISASVYPAVAFSCERAASRLSRLRFQRTLRGPVPGLSYTFPRTRMNVQGINIA